LKTLAVLTSEHPDDNNSLEDPAAVVPVSSRIASIETDFRHNFPAYSLTVMRLKK
jgi:alpha-N-arabinofuranosidase